ncbi:hypothetical protein Y032_0064g3506 [Ancylostoma ceylanicum]|uniref:Uncharacterized protein n=1 Tax=Ancylostoma ceylanicum TaxID=53326 RepID=A0A016U1J9_9BILA|nr:hypothetical protein Y032_0064g3506 [Ancylostoma ceylanicum]
MYFVVFLIQILQALDLPLAPYNVKVFCRQGRRYTRQVQTALECSSSTTACGFFEFNGPDERNGVEKIGVYECVDNGILHVSDSAEEDTNIELFSELCGAVPQCSSLSLDSLNPAFVKYLIIHHGIQLELLTSRNIRFCCSLFHHTLQKLVTSEVDRLPSVPAPPVHCQSEVCGPEAVGCLLHSLTTDSEEEYEDDERRARRKASQRQLRKRQTDDYDVVELFFDFEEDQDDSAVQFVTRPPTTTTRPSRAVVKKPTAIVRVTPPQNKFVTTTTTTTKRPKPQHDEYGDHEDVEETHCVYRHLNDEMYRYCLLVHQKKDGDRCYYHEGHTICCCFVPPDKETCDPMEMDLVRPPSLSKLPPIHVTARPAGSSRSTAPTTSTASPTTSSTTTSTTTTTTTTTTVFPSTRRPYRPTPSGNQLNKRCRITYPRKKTDKMRPTLVCDSAYSIVSYLLFCSLLFHVF